MASCKKPVYKVEIKTISEKKRRSSDLVIMWQSLLDLSVCILDKCWTISKYIWDTTKIWIKADDQKEIMTWLEKHLSAAPLDFTYSWRDGVLLSVLLNKLRPGCFPDAENLDTEYGLRNVYRALNVLEARFKIVPKVSAEEIVTCCKGSDQKLQDLLLQLKEKTDKEPHQTNPSEEQCEGTEERPSPPARMPDACVARGTGLLVGFFGREATFTVYYTSLSELDLVVEIRGPGNELCSERITKRSPKRKQSVRNWKPSPPCLERSNSEKNNLPPGIVMPGEDPKRPPESRLIPLKYEIRANQIDFAYTPFTKGRHKVSLLHCGQHISDSPYFVSVEPDVGTYKRGVSLKSALKASKSEEEAPKKESVRFQVPEEKKRSFGKVVKRRVLRYIVKIDKKDIVVDTDSIDQLASALLKMDYELQKRPLIRRNSWGFVGDAERKVSMIRQFCVDVDELEAQCLKMHRSHSLTLATKPKKAFPKKSSYECEDILCRSKLETVCEGKDLKESSHREDDEEEALAYLNEEFDSDKPVLDETTTEVSQLRDKETIIQPKLLPFTWPSQSKQQQTGEVNLDVEETQPESDIEIHRGSESSDLLLSSNASNSSFPQSMENDLNLEAREIKAPDGPKDVEGNNQHSNIESFRTDIEEPFTKTVIKKLGNDPVSKENSPVTLTPKMDENEINRKGSEHVQLFNFYHKMAILDNETKNIQKRSSPLKNFDSRQVYIPPCCGNRRQRSCHNKTPKHRNNYKNCTIKPLNVVYFPVCKEYFCKHSPRSSEVKLQKRTKNNNSNILRNSNFDQSSLKHNQYSYSTIKQTPTIQDMNITNSNFQPKNSDVTKSSDYSATKPLCYPHLKSSNSNKSKAHVIGSNTHEIKSSFTKPNQIKVTEQNHAPTAQLNPEYSLKNFSIKKQSLVPLGQLHYRHFNPVVENKKDGPVKLRVKQWQKPVARDEPYKGKVTQKLDTLPEKGNLTAKLKFWESIQQKNNEASPDGPTSDSESRKKVNETIERENRENRDLNENSTSMILNISDTDSASKASNSKANLCSQNSHHFTEKANDKLMLPFPAINTRVRKRSFSDPGNFGTPQSSDVSALAETLPEPIRENLSSSSDANYLELSADDEISSVDLLYSTEDEYIDDEISDTASTYWGDLSFIKDLKLADASAYREFCSLIDSKYLADRRDSSDSCSCECQVYGIANYFGHVAVKNRFRVLTNGAGCGNLSATVQGLGHHEVSFVSVEYVQKDVYEVTYQVLTPGLYLISVRWMETPISGSPFLCKVTF